MPLALSALRAKMRDNAVRAAQLLSVWSRLDYAQCPSCAKILPANKYGIPYDYC
jgi:hypothetical protein